MRVGIDFDNTIADYDRVFCELACKWRLLPDDFVGTKADVRTALFYQPDGERKWMRLQGRVYGAGMPHAEIVAGAREFVALCRARGVEVFVVSHKTVHGHFDPERIDLRVAAWTWMEANGFFRPGIVDLRRDAVFFESTREAKVARIAALGCTHFIDDLPEIFYERGFPTNTKALLLDRVGAIGDGSGRFRAFRSFSEIAHALFPDAT